MQICRKIDYIWSKDIKRQGDVQASPCLVDYLSGINTCSVNQLLLWWSVIVPP